MMKCLDSLPRDLASREAKFGSPTAQGGGACPIPDAGGAASLPADPMVGTARRAVRGCSAVVVAGLAEAGAVGCLI